MMGDENYSREHAHTSTGLEVVRYVGEGGRESGKDVEFAGEANKTVAVGTAVAVTMSVSSLP